MNKSYSIKDVTKLLIKDAGIKEGFYHAVITPNLNGAVVSPDDSNEHFQSIMLIIESINLTATEKENPLAVDASQVQ